ncbi:MAG TPA: hypothetical protein VN436_17245 [Holophaga sp.]|nr:hypothetical protein [Holophaga sp.]
MQISGVQGVSSQLVTKASGTTSYDPRDTNKDGIVSATEAQVYAWQHPAQSSGTDTTSTTQYNAAGSMNTSGSSQIDQYA